MAKIETVGGAAFLGGQMPPAELALPLSEVQAGMDVTVLQTHHVATLVDRSMSPVDTPTDTFEPGREIPELRQQFTLPVQHVAMESETLYLGGGRSPVLVLPVGVRPEMGDRNSDPTKPIYSRRPYIASFIINTLFRPVAL